MYRRAQEGDRLQVIALWGDVFGDDTATIEHCLDRFAGAQNVFVAEEKERIIASMLAVPCMAGKQKGIYLYALATRPDSRGRGVMSGLMAYVEREAVVWGAAFAALIPANDRLFGFYEARGYGTLWLRCLRWRLDEMVDALHAGEDGDIKTGPLGAERFLALRKVCLAGVSPICFSPARTALVLQDLWEEGARAACSENGYALYFPNAGRPLVAELAADETEANRLLARVARETGAAELTLTLPADGTLWPGEGALHREAQLKWLTPTGGCGRGSSFYGQECPMPPTYLRFALDELGARLQRYKTDG